MDSKTCSSLSLLGALLLSPVAVPVASVRPAPESFLIPDWQAEGNQAAAFFGDGVADAGDVNGDGYDDILVAARGFDNGEVDEGKVFLFLGSSSGPELAPVWSAEGNQPYANFGRPARAGDVNGDGFGDVIIGAGLYDNGQADEGRAFLYLGSPAGLAASPAWTAEGNQPSAFFGSFVAAAGDVNGDGFDDVLVGAQQYTNVELQEGAAYLYLGGPSGLAAAPAWVAEGNQEGAWFSRVSAAGDINGDGFDDIMVGAPFYDHGQPGEGAVFIYKGSARGLRTRPWRILETDESGAHLGWRCGPAGDINGDGFADIIVAALGALTLPAPDKVYVYPGSASGPRTRSPVVLTPEGQPVADFGWSLASAGDVNGDGFGDVLVGARAQNLAGVRQGRVYLYAGSSAGLDPKAARLIDGAQTREEFGYSVDSAGDVNGDGFDDIIVGGHGYDDPELNEGRAVVYLGSASLAGAAPPGGALRPPPRDPFRVPHAPR